MCLSMQEQLQLMYIQAMLVDSQLYLGSSKQYDLLKMVFMMMFITKLVKNINYLTVCHIQYVTLSDSIRIINICSYIW